MDLDAKERLAKAATPGPWEDQDGAVWASCGWWIFTDSNSADSAYIAAMSPNVGLGLLAEARALRAGIERLESLDQVFTGDGPGGRMWLWCCGAKWIARGDRDETGLVPHSDGCFLFGDGALLSVLDSLETTDTALRVEWVEP